MAQLAYGGDARAESVFTTVGRSLAVALANLVNTLNLPLYLLGGGVSDSWDLFSNDMFVELRRRSFLYRLTEPQTKETSTLEHQKTYVLRAELGPTAGLLGACVFALQSIGHKER